jgi:general stress protein 26
MVSDFAEIADEFDQRVRRIVWCTVATVDQSNRLRSRILHPVWEGSTGWIATGRHSPKERHLRHNQHVSLSYWDQEHEQVYADCRADWCDDAGQRERVWQLIKNQPAPVGYDPGLFWKSPEDPEYGLLQLTPWRIELWSLAEMIAGKEPRVWVP